MIIIRNTKARLLLWMQEYNGPDWLPTNDELHIFAVLTATLFAYDPIGVQNALDFGFSLKDIDDEYDLEASALLRCRTQWPDEPCLGHAIKDVLDYYFYEDYPWEDCLFLAEQAMPSIKDRRVLLDLDAINNFMVQRRPKWTLIEIE